MPSTPISGARYPAPSASPNVPQDLQNLALDYDAKVITHFSTTGTRDSTITSPTEGLYCTVGSPAATYTYRGSAWRPLSDDVSGPAWITPSFATGFGAQSGGGYGTPQYRVHHGIVEWKGTVRYITASAIPIDTLMCASSDFVPTGSPTAGSAVVIATVGTNTSNPDPATAANMGTVWVVIRNDGGVRLYPTTTTTPAMNLVFLDGIRWSVG